MKGNGLQGQAKAVLPLQSLDERLSDATLEAVGSIFWEPAAEVNLTFSSQTDVTTKVCVFVGDRKGEMTWVRIFIICPYHMKISLRASVRVSEGQGEPF